MGRLIAKERTQALLTGVLKDEDEATVDGANLMNLRLWLYDQNGSVINSRSSQDINGANGGEVDGSGNFSLRLGADDNVISGTEEYEKHTALVKFEWASKEGWEEIDFYVQNLDYVPPS